VEVKAIRGMSDILPGEIPTWRFVEETVRKVFGLYGFVELRTPVLERTELFLRGIGNETDVVEKQMYTFTDKSGASVSLRPEATASVLRAVIEHGLLSEDPIRKIFSMGPMFRYERPQKGRYRQFHQINAERLGEGGPFSDAETLQMAYALANALGLKGLAMEVNSLGCEACREGFKKALQTFLGKQADRLCADCARRMTANPLRVLDCKVVSCKQAAEGAPLIEDHLCSECRGHYDQVLSYLESFGVPYAKSPSLVRGLDYYTRTTFEITAKGLGSQNAVAGGGRYDNLVGILGGPDVPGIGFAFGVERVILLLEEREAREEGCFVAAQGDERVKAAAVGLLSELRSAGITAQAVLEKSFKAQMRRAGKSGYPFCAIIGQDELEKSLVTVKDLGASSQFQVQRSDAREKIHTLLKDRKGESR